MSALTEIIQNPQGYPHPVIFSPPGYNHTTICSPAKMSNVGPALKEWPPVNLIAGLSLKTTAEAESELDEKVISGKVFPSLNGLRSSR